MNIKIDLKSALFGAAVSVFVLLAIAAADAPNSNGRFQVAGGAGFFTIVDTATGQAWSANLAAPGLLGLQAGFAEKKVDK